MGERKRSVENLEMSKMLLTYELDQFIASQEITPVFDENCVPIVYLSDTCYLPILCVSIKSLIDSSSSKHNYDVVIIHRGIELADQEIIKDLVQGKNNISIRFFDDKDICLKPSSLTDYSIPLSLYRVYCPMIMKGYERVILLGADTIVNSDIFDLCKIEFESNNVAAGVFRDFTETNNELFRTVYLDTDVLILQFSKIRNLFSKGFNYSLRLPQQHCYDFILDRLVFTDILSSKIQILDDKWNFAPNEHTGETCLEAMSNSRIIHYTGMPKPWSAPMMFMGEVWWRKARGTVYYEELLRRLCQSPDNRSTTRKFIDRILPRGSKLRNLVKRVISFFRRLTKKRGE